MVALLPELKKWALSKGLYPLPKVLQNNEFGSSVPDDQLKILIGQYSEFFKPRLAELSGGEDMLPQQRTYNTPLLPGYVPQGNKVPYNGPLRPTGQTQQAQQSPQKLNFKEAVNALSPDARRILEGASTSEDVLNNTRALIEAKYPNATPAEKAELANALYSR